VKIVVKFAFFSWWGFLKIFKMSTFPNTVSDGRRVAGKAPEKFKFSQTCSLLSQFLKEKRISGDSASGLFGKMEPKGTIFF
jgi:jasmonate ZIM domain-containing protein